MTTLMFQDLYRGEIAKVSTTITKLNKTVAREELKPYRDKLIALFNLKRLIRTGEPFYARITAGCRTGSIVRVDSSQYKAAQASKSYYGRELGLVSVDSATVRLVSDYTHSMMFHITVEETISTNIHYTARIIAQYDGRKDVQLSQDEQYSLEYLDGYEGPTVYAYTRTERTPEERAAMRDLAQHKVFDQIGEEIKLGDLFFYGGANNLTIGKLVKIGSTGSLGYLSFIGNEPGRIITETVRKHVSQGKHVPCLLKYSKDLGDRLMIFKLSA